MAKSHCIYLSIPKLHLCNRGSLGIDKCSVITIIANSDADLGGLWILVRLANWQLKKYISTFSEMFGFCAMRPGNYRHVSRYLFCVLLHLLLLDLPITFRVIWMAMRQSTTAPMMTLSSGGIFCGPLWRKSTGHQWIPLTKATDAELWCFHWFEPQTNGWANNRDACDLRRRRAHYDVTVMQCQWSQLE